jgi:hypothetical protein
LPLRIEHSNGGFCRFERLGVGFPVQREPLLVGASVGFCPNYCQLVERASQIARLVALANFDALIPPALIFDFDATIYGWALPV